MMKRIFSCLICFICIMITVQALAIIRSFIKEYNYQASELDSKTSCRAIAVEQVKRELLEELGTYVESTTVVKDLQIENDEIRTISAGVVQTRVLDEKWDGRDYWLKAEVSADPDEVAASIAKVRNDSKLTEELAETREEKENALKEVERLKRELADSQEDSEKLAEYNAAVNQIQASDSFEQGTALSVAGDYEGAAKAYDRTIALRPNDAKAFFNRSIVYIFLGDYSRATNDLDRAMLIRPANTNMYYQRATAYKELHEKSRFTKPEKPSPWFRRPYRTTQPKEDPLQKFLDRKKFEHKFVRQNPFGAKQHSKNVNRNSRMQPVAPVYLPERRRKLDAGSTAHTNQNNAINQRDGIRRQHEPLSSPARPYVTRSKRPDTNQRVPLAPLAKPLQKQADQRRVSPEEKKSKDFAKGKKRKQQDEHRDEERPIRR